MTSSQDEIVFVGASGPALVPGEEANFGRISDFFGRSREEVQAEWQQIVTNTQHMLNQPYPRRQVQPARDSDRPGIQR